MELTIPIIIVNFKTYSEATGKNAEKLSKICEKISKEQGIVISVAVQAGDIYRISSKIKVPVISEHMDFSDPGAHTGSVTGEDILENGGIGTLINHSEDRIPMGEIEKIISKAKKLRLYTIVCAETPDEAEEIAKLNPDFIAIEPPELIGGDISVSNAKPEIITNTTLKVKKINDSELFNVKVLCGAGVKNKEDVSKAIKLGAKGILVASGVTKAKDPEKMLREFCEGMKQK